MYQRNQEEEQQGSSSRVLLITAVSDIFCEMRFIA